VSSVFLEKEANCICGHHPMVEPRSSEPGNDRLARSPSRAKSVLERNDKLHKLKHCAKKQVLLRLASEENVPLAGLFEEVTEAKEPPPKPSPFERAFERAMTVTEQDKANWRQFGFISLDFTESESKAAGGAPIRDNPGSTDTDGRALDADGTTRLVPTE